MKIEIISKETIKPSSPTPPHLRTFNLSVLDQIISTPYAPLILYYSNQNGTTLHALERSIALKKALSKTLTQFYPLAGTIINDLSIDCNDVGAYYALALVRLHLNEFLSQPDYSLINRFLPVEPTLMPSGASAHLTNIQVNIFQCGGIAIALCISHKILDGAALNIFLKVWAFMTCGAEEVVYPNLSAPSLFPAKDLWLRDSSMAMWEPFIKKGKCITKRIVFNSDSIAQLKAKIARSGVQNPTRVEVVSALIWRCAMAASKEACGFQKPSSLAHTVNLRRKLAAKDLIGNVFWIARAMFQPNNEHEPTLDGLVKKVHEGISKVDIEFVNKIQGEKGYVAMQEYHREMWEIRSEGIIDNYIFTSWCNMGFYEIDFGWGKPSWVTGIDCNGNPVFMNLVILMDTKFGEGIEAWVNLDEEEMIILQRNPELLGFASIDPSPLSTR